MSKSNINVVSNIYIRQPESISNGIDKLEKDPQFVHQVTGIKALEKIIKDFPNVHLDAAQRYEYSQAVTCTYVKNGETPFGKVRQSDGTIKYECRCEYRSCKNYNTSICHIEKELIRKSKIKSDNTDEKMPDELEWIGVSSNEDVFRVKDNEETIKPEEKLDIVKINEDKAEFEVINSTDAVSKIIESDFDSKILVNAGPGSGKTYTAIQRLLYILRNYESLTEELDSYDYDRILVLCYTRAAVSEIKNRINQGIINGSIPAEATNVTISTFDSFATSYLTGIENPLTPDELHSLNYNQRIQKFNELIDSSYFEDFQYCIIDELQDLVNERAKMTLNLLKVLKCGYLLLGDKCQAIYDYDCRDNTSINSTLFYKELNNIFPEQIIKYEIEGNKRQSKELEQITSELRQQLLNFNKKTIKKIFKMNLDNINDADFYAEDFIMNENQGITAILCRNNGEAEYMSSILHKKQIDHTLIRNSGQENTLKRFISDSLWDFDGKIISKEQFEQRICIRCNLTEEQSKTLYECISDLIYDENRNYIEIGKLCEILCTTHSNDLPKEITNLTNTNLIVTTIHKAKGREFDTVYLLDYNYDESKKIESNDTEEERVLYVALTRPKKDIKILRKKHKYSWTFKKNQNGRFIRVKRKNYKNYCVGYATGLKEDIDYSSFVSGTLIEAVNRQAYIAQNVKAGDNITLKFDGKKYNIMHNNVIIGQMTDLYKENLFEKFHNKQYVFQAPDEICNLYVDNVFTYVSYRDFENIPQKFRQRRLWLAVEITGFGNTLWENNK